MTPTNRNNPQRAKSSESSYALMEFMREFPDDETCLQWLWVKRFSSDGEHAYCPKCEQVRVFKKYETSQTRQSWTCTGCGLHIHPTAGTIYEKSSTSLHLWFYAIYLMTSTRCGISAKQMERELGVTYKTAWRICKEIRTKVMEQQDDETLSGTVELDETYVGGKRRGTPRGRPNAESHKVPVFGMVERQGKVVALTVPNAKGKTLMGHVVEHVIPASTVYTDDFRAYNFMKKLDYKHDIINHSEKVYVSGDVHTNTIEGFWSLVKRGVGGVYHSVSAKYLQGYLNEYVWRYNHRKDEKSTFFAALLRSASGS
jgi:transposase